MGQMLTKVQDSMGTPVASDLSRSRSITSCTRGISGTPPNFDEHEKGDGASSCTCKTWRPPPSFSPPMSNYFSSSLTTAIAQADRTRGARLGCISSFSPYPDHLGRKELLCTVAVICIQFLVTPRVGDLARQQKSGTKSSRQGGHSCISLVR